MPRTPPEKLIPKADRLIINSFPRIAKRLEAQVNTLDRAEMDAYLKMLPGAIERFQAVALPTNDLHEVVQGAIDQLIVSFGSRNASAVELSDPAGTSNPPQELEETAGGVSEPELPEGSDTDQSVASNALPHNELEASAGNGGEPGTPQERPQNARVRTRSKLSGRAIAKRGVWGPGKSADDQGRLSESEGGSQTK